MSDIYTSNDTYTECSCRVCIFKTKKSQNLKVLELWLLGVQDFLRITASEFFVKHNDIQAGTILI